VNYSKWEKLALEEEEDEKMAKEEIRNQNRQRYMKEQAEKQQKYLQQQNKATEHQQSQNDGHHNQNCDDDHHGHDHDNQNVSQSKRIEGNSGNSSGIGSTMESNQSFGNERLCGCGYVDPERLKELSKQREANPPLPLEEKNKKKMLAVEAAKEDGNIQFKQGNYQLALQIYERGVLIVNGTYGMDENDSAKMSKLEKELDLNMALCRIKLKQYPEAIENCKMVLNFDKTNVKALFRKGQAYLLMGEYDQAEKDFHDVLQLDSNNAATKKEMQILQKLRLEQNQKTKKFQASLATKLQQNFESTGLADPTI